MASIEVKYLLIDLFGAFPFHLPLQTERTIEPDNDLQTVFPQFILLGVCLYLIH
jgi:hypothetical protein